MKNFTFLHTADLHLDLPVRGWSEEGTQLAIRQGDYRETFQRIIQQCLHQDADFLFIIGDFLEYETVRRQTVEWVISELEKIPNTHVLIAPGNHDALREDSFYITLSWPKNVHIFSSHWEDRWYPEYQLRIYGRGFSEFEEPNSFLPTVDVSNEERRIMLVHGTYLENETPCSYFPLYKAQLTPLEFDYIAMGHIHRTVDYRLSNQRQTLVHYPGSPEATNWKETGERTITLGYFQGKEKKVKQLPIQSRKYHQMEVRCTDCGTEEGLLTTVIAHLQKKGKKEECYRIALTGYRRRDITWSIPWVTIKLKEQGYFYVDIRDDTVADYDMEKLVTQDGLVGEFVRRMQEKIHTASREDQALLQKALYRGLDALLLGKGERT